jgi:adenylate kinase family enzyme
MEYNLSTLNDKDLEELVRDLFSNKMNLNFQSFRIGRDKGIDLRYSTSSNENEIIIQVKHYIGSKFSNLKYILKNQELEKISKLKPARYIVVTSLPLNPDEKEIIKEILSPYIQSTNDIYGKEGLNSLLGEFPKIVEKYYKLWLSSTTILQQILKNAVKGRSEFEIFKIEKKISIFVQNDTYNKAVKILNNKNFILISGAPGIGKTSLANMLTYQLLAEDFDLVYVREIQEAEEAYERDRQQVFYFDDFLGSITLDLQSSRNVDSSIVNFIERVRNDKQKRLILTSRTTIINQAKNKSEKLNDSKINIAEHEIKIEDYSNLDKAKILYNHIYFSNLTDEFKDIFFQNKFYWKVIKHRNYNPRLIEFFTDIDRVENEDNYESAVLNYLDFPDKIWEKSFENQISETSRMFLTTLFSLRGYYVVGEDKLKEAFEKRLDYEIRYNNYTKSNNVFRNTVRELQNAFIVRVINSKYNSIEYKFLNPSIEDFLVYYYNNNIDVYFTSLKSAIYFEQFKNQIATTDGNRRIVFTGNDYRKLLNLFNDKVFELKSYSNNDELDAIICLIRLFKLNDIKSAVIKLFKRCKLGYLGWTDKQNLIDILKYFAKNKMIPLIPFTLKELFIKLTEDMPSHYLFFEIESLSEIDDYKSAILDMKKTDKISYKVYKENVLSFWESELYKFVCDESEIKYAESIDGLKNTVRDRIKEAKKANKKIGIFDNSVFKKYQFDYERQLEENANERNNLPLVIEEIKKQEIISNENLVIDKLFNNEAAQGDMQV